METNVTGSFLISRSDDKSNFTIWDEITRFNLVGQAPSSWTWKDFTVEHGVKYRYALQQYNENNLYSEKILSVYLDDFDNEIKEPLEVYFEDAFLYDGEIQLKVKYNPRVSSFKTDLMEAKIDTIGSKYPFIFRNGAVEYKEFPISGLISYLSDEENLFATDEELDLTKNFTNWNRETTLTVPKDINPDDYFFDLEVYSDLSYDEIETMRQGYERRKLEEKDIVEAKQRTTNLLDYNMAAERTFKLKVLDWLNNGKVKLFRSPAEGNYIVRLMNVSLSPEDRVGRMLHTFSCTAYEIDECTYENLLSYKLLNSTLKAGRVYNQYTIELWKTENYEGDDDYEEITEGFAVIKYGRNLFPNHKEVIGVEFSDMPDSGMSANIILDDKEKLIKGNLPSYRPDLQLTFDSLEITESLYNYMRSCSDEIIAYNLDPPLITVSYYEVSDSIFNTVTDIVLDTIPARQWLGSSKHISQKYLNEDEIDELRNDNSATIIKTEHDINNELNYHQLVTYETDNFIDMFNNNKENMLRFLYIHFYKREVSDERNDNSETYAWRLEGINRNILTNYMDTGNGPMQPTGLTINLFEDNSTKHLDQDVMYKFIFKRQISVINPATNQSEEVFNRIKQIPSVQRGRTGAFPVSEGQHLRGDVIFYYDITHPYTIYYDKYYFIDQESLYTTTQTKTPLDPADIRLFEDFNKKPYKLKFEPYDLTFAFNNGDDISLEYEVIKDRVRPTPLVAKSVTVGCGVGLNYAIETQTLSYHIEDNSEVLHEYPEQPIPLSDDEWTGEHGEPNLNYYFEQGNFSEEVVPPYYFYQKYYGNTKFGTEGCIDIINNDYSADINYEDENQNEIMDKIDDAFKALNKLYIAWYLDSSNKSYCIIHKLKDKAIIQLDRQLAAWKEEELY